MIAGRPTSNAAPARLTVWSMIVMSVAELANQFLGVGSAAAVSSAAFCVASLSILPRFGLREWALLAMGGAFAAFAFVSGVAGAVVGEALSRAAFFGAFIYLVTLLKEAAERSPSVLKVGRFLTNQPDGKRYWATAVGGHLFGVLLNFGAISLFAPLIQRGAKSLAGAYGNVAELYAQLERRQLSALIRGFSWMVIWSPTALTQAVLLSAFPEAGFLEVVGLGILATMIMIVAGHLEDRLYWRRKAAPIAVLAEEFPARAAGTLVYVALFLVGGSVLASTLSEKSVAVCLMLVAPLVTSFWVFVQNGQGKGEQRLRLWVGTLRQIVSSSVHGQSRSMFALGMSAFIGVIAAKLAPVAEISDALDLAKVPSWLFLAALPTTIILCGQLALSPIMVVVFLSTLINGLEFVPADPSLIVFALGAGWALSMTASPNATASLLISGVTGIAPTTMTWRWNGRYAMVCLAAFFGLFWAFSQ